MELLDYLDGVLLMCLVAYCNLILGAILPSILSVVIILSIGMEVHILSLPFSHCSYNEFIWGHKRKQTSFIKSLHTSKH